MRRPQTELQLFILSLLWKTSRSFRFAHDSHVNLQEMRALKAEVKDQSINGKPGRRVLNCCDSRVVTGAYGKGRSSSNKLNGIQRSTMGYSLAGRLRVCNIWVDTHSNPADHPSRFRPIPDGPQAVCPERYRSWLPNSGAEFLEIGDVVDVV